MHHSRRSLFKPVSLSKIRSHWGAITASILWLSISLSRAQLVNVDFNENDGVGWGGGGPNPGPTMSGAAVLGAAGDLWNGIDVSSGTNIALSDVNGNASPVTLTFTSGGGYDVHSFGGSTPFAGTGYDALMEDYLFNSGVAQTITLAGLATNAAYNLVLYNAANSGTAGRTTYFTVNGVSKSGTWDGASSTLIPGIDYVNFTCAMSDSSGKLVITYRGDGTAEGDVDGLQIQAAPLTIAATYDGTNVMISFPTQAGLSYQAEYMANLTDAGWSGLAAPFSGNGQVATVNNLATGGSRFYRVQISPNPPNPVSWLHTSGTNLVNASGTVVQLKGLNLGGWFIMEKWMCPLDNSGNLPDTYSAITNLDHRFGVATEQNLIRSYQTNWITTNDLGNIASAGFNCVRMPVWWGNFFSITNTTSSGWRSDAFAELDWLVTNCASRGIYVVIDMHGVVGGQSVSGDTGWQNQNQYWTSSTDQSQTAYMWAQIAAHYAGNSAVAGYDLLNEPSGAPGAAAVLAAYTNLYTTIRAIDPVHIAFIEGTFGNWDWSMLPNPSVYGWTNVVYSMHEYQFGATNAAGIEAGSDNQVSDFRNHTSYNVPDYVGEWNDLGHGAPVYDYSINVYNNAGISWSMWAYKATDGLLPDGWGWYDPSHWPNTPNLETDSAATIANDWMQWRTTTSFGVNAAVGL